MVDNNSRDRTRDVVADFCRRYPARFRYLFESHPGKSYALNSGIAEARGDIVAFMDDDVTVEPTWLQNLTAPLLKGKWAGCGGRIVPVWNCTPPRWLPDAGQRALAPLAIFDLGPEAGRLAGGSFWHEHGVHERPCLQAMAVFEPTWAPALQMKFVARTLSSVVGCSQPTNDCGMNHRRLCTTQCRRIACGGNTFKPGGLTKLALIFRADGIPS